MLFVWIALWLLAILLLCMDYRSLTMRWVSSVAFAGGIGALAAVLDESLIPSIRNSMPNPVLENALSYLVAICSISSYYGLPYAFAMLARQYHPVFTHTKLYQAMPYLLMVPQAACLIFTHGYTVEIPIDF